jgi:flagellar biosynthetic protein FlhB
MSDDRTEKPTPKRREDARRQGQIARRPQLPAAAAFMAALTALHVTGADFGLRGGRLLAGIVKYIANPEALTIQTVQGMLIDASIQLALMASPVIAAALAAGLAGNFAQGGFTLTPEALIPKADRFNPAANLKRVFSVDRIVELIKELLVLVGIGGACYGVFCGAMENAGSFVGLPAAQTLITTSELVVQLGMRAGGVLLLLSLMDYGYGWYKHEQSLRMTRQEIKDEFKQQEGDPMVKALRRRAARALTHRQIIHEVPLADVVVTNPTHFAVALRYDRNEHTAPIVVAKGVDLMAKRIRDIAKAYDVPIVENPPLARMLYKKVDAHDVIPPELFRAVAELLAYVYRQQNPNSREQ